VINALTSHDPCRGTNHDRQSSIRAFATSRASTRKAVFTKETSCRLYKLPTSTFDCTLHSTRHRAHAWLGTAYGVEKHTMWYNFCIGGGGVGSSIALGTALQNWLVRMSCIAMVGTNGRDRWHFLKGQKTPSTPRTSNLAQSNQCQTLVKAPIIFRTFRYPYFHRAVDMIHYKMASQPMALKQVVIDLLYPWTDGPRLTRSLSLTDRFGKKLVTAYLLANRSVSPVAVAAIPHQRPRVRIATVRAFVPTNITVRKGMWA